MKDPNWDDVDALVQLRDRSTHKMISLSGLEVAVAKKDTPEIDRFVKMLKGDDSKVEADVFPFGEIRLTASVLKNRFLKWFEDDELVNRMYVQATRRKKEIEKKTEKKEDIEEEIAPPKKEETKKTEKKTKKKMPTVTMAIREQIQFEHLQPNEELTPYIPESDDNYVFPGWTLEFVRMVDNGINVWLHGGSGAGKSSLAEQICATGNLPLMYQSFHEDVKPDQLFGGKELVDGNTVWYDGPVTKAYREGFVLLLDEIDGLPPEIQFCLYGILDRKPLVLAENGNEVVKAHPNFRVVATGNTLGRGDETGMFAGTNILNRAFLNRFRVWYKVNYPSENIYRAIIEREGVDQDVAKVVARLAKEINSGYENQTLTETFSLRDAREVAKVAELTDGDVGRALQLTLLNRLSSVEMAVVQELFRSIVPKDM